MILCPCRKCLIEPICKTSCDKFSIFITPISKFTDGLERVCEWVDHNIKDGGVLDRIFEFVGTKVVDPVLFYTFKHAFRIKIHRKDMWLFDERYTDWENKQEAKQ